MSHEVFCPCKINLSLRVTSIRDDGFHDLVSLFLKVPHVEKLTIKELAANNVKDDIISHNFDIVGENILSKVLFSLRNQGWPIPSLKIEIFKEIPPGTGLGGGSGNAAALIAWLGKRYGIYPGPEECSLIGSDVSFLAGDKDLAMVRGVGDRFTSCDIKPGLVSIVFIPEWVSGTPESYRKLDLWYRENGFPMTEKEAVNEAREIVCGLNLGRSPGILPNDFLPLLLHEWPGYSDLFAIVEKTGALAWGITGSGSASFAIYDRGVDELRGIESHFDSIKWLRKIFLWSDDR